MSLYSDLGVTDEASGAVIKRAHRRAVKAAHPDAGGTPEAFERVQRAWLVLSDPQRRDRYDKTGEVDEAPKNTEEQLAQSMVAQLIMGFLAGNQPLDSTDIMALARKALRDQRAQHEQNIREIDSAAKRVATMRKRLRRKDGAAGTIAQMLTARERELEVGKSQQEQGIRVVEMARGLLEEYTYEAEAAEPAEPMWNVGLGLRGGISGLYGLGG